jgi:hypothetical protein
MTTNEAIFTGSDSCRCNLAWWAQVLIADESIAHVEIAVCLACNLGTASVHLRTRKNGFLLVKRHQAKHLEVLVL